MAAERLRARGPDWEAPAAVLASASAHWLRHTAGSYMTDQQVDLRYVRDTFGHASIATHQRLPAQRRGCATPGHAGAAPHRLDQQDVVCVPVDAPIAFPHRSRSPSEPDAHPDRGPRLFQPGMLSPGRILAGLGRMALLPPSSRATFFSIVRSQVVLADRSGCGLPPDPGPRSRRRPQLETTRAHHPHRCQVR